MTGSDFHSVTRVGSMQPYFLPYLGYFSLIKHADIWVVFDTPKFIRHGWIERNGSSAQGTVGNTSASH